MHGLYPGVQYVAAGDAPPAATLAAVTPGTAIANAMTTVDSLLLFSATGTPIARLRYPSIIACPHAVWRTQAPCRGPSVTTVRPAIITDLDRWFRSVMSWSLGWRHRETHRI